jgi:rhodanese-related sulfurtransferase
VTIEERLAAARARITRIDPLDLDLADDVLVIDLRCREEREATGVIPGSISVLRSHLEWRCDPSSPWADPRVARPDLPTFLVCADGFSSSLAAESLLDLGFERSGDLVGGMNAWVAAGMAIQPASEQPETPYPSRP